MGQQETKPVFPSEEQWNTWKVEKNATIANELSNFQKKRNIEIHEDVAYAFVLFDNYMAACHDKSKIKRFFADNDECTTTRHMIITHLAKTTQKYMTDETIAAGIVQLGNIGGIKK